MKAFSLGSAFKQANPWICRQCLHQSQRTTRSLREYSTRGNRIPVPKKKGRIFLAATTGALGVTALAFTDDVKHSYRAVERTGRVVGTLFVCINE
jgi:aarF domain-containing kinase